MQSSIFTKANNRTFNIQHTFTRSRLFYVFNVDVRTTTQIYTICTNCQNNPNIEKRYGLKSILKYKYDTGSAIFIERQISKVQDQ